MDKKVKWGIIAAGGIAMRRTLPAMEFCKNAEIIAVMDKNVEALKEIQREYGIPYIYEDEDELLKNPEVESVYVASPVCFHKEQARKVLATGRHLLLEKPVGLTLEEAEEVRTYAEQSKLKVGIGMVMKMHPGHRKIREMIRQGVLGEIVNCRARLTCWFPDMENNWRQKWSTGGGGALVDMGIHCIDLVRWLLDDDVETVYGDVCTKTFHYEVDDSADCILRMKKGTACFVDVHFNIPDECSQGILEIYGTKGSIMAYGTIGQDSGGKIFVTLSGQQDGYHSQQNRDDVSAARLLEYEQENIYARQIAQFSEMVLHGGKPSTTIDHACETMRVIDALYRSAREETVVRLYQ